MKNTKRISLLIGAVALSPAALASVSYLSLRPIFEVTSPERISMFRDRADAREDGHGTAIQAVALGGSTTHGDDLARYFLPNGKSWMIVSEDNAPSAINRTRDMNAVFAGVLTIPTAGLTGPAFVGNYDHLTYEAKLTFCPKSTVAGVGLTWMQRLHHHRTWWFDIAAPILRVENTMGMRENIYNTGMQSADFLFNTATEGLGCDNSSSDKPWKRNYGNITCKKLSKTKVAFVEMRIGKDVACHPECKHDWYLGITIPTGNKPTQKFLFEPVVGNNGHVGLFAGGDTHFELLRDAKDHVFTASGSFVARYFIPNREWRSFDLKNKPWSRYMIVLKNSDTLPDPSTVDGFQDGMNNHFAPLINYTTMCAEVRSLYNVEFNTAVWYKSGGFKGEVGYDFFGRKGEEIIFDRGFGGGQGLEGLAYWIVNNEEAAPATRSFADITSNVWGDDRGDFVDERWLSPNGGTPTYVPITIDSLDPRSAATPAYMTQSFWAALSYNWDNIEYPTFISVGASYEFSRSYMFLNRWLAWLRLGMSI